MRLVTGRSGARVGLGLAPILAASDARLVAPVAGAAILANPDIARRLPGAARSLHWGWLAS